MYAPRTTIELLLLSESTCCENPFTYSKGGHTPQSLERLLAFFAYFDRGSYVYEVEDFTTNASRVKRPGRRIVGFIFVDFSTLVHVG
jgi:hypothetical protein